MRIRGKLQHLERKNGKNAHILRLERWRCLVEAAGGAFNFKARRRDKTSKAGAVAGGRERPI